MAGTKPYGEHTEKMHMEILGNGGYEKKVEKSKHDPLEVHEDAADKPADAEARGVLLETAGQLLETTGTTRCWPTSWELVDGTVTNAGCYCCTGKPDEPQTTYTDALSMRSAEQCMKVSKKGDPHAPFKAGNVQRALKAGLKRTVGKFYSALTKQASCSRTCTNLAECEKKKATDDSLRDLSLTSDLSLYKYGYYLTQAVAPLMTEVDEVNHETSNAGTNNEVNHETSNAGSESGPTNKVTPVVEHVAIGDPEAGWRMYYSTGDGLPYFHYTMTEETSWNLPDAWKTACDHFFTFETCPTARCTYDDNTCSPRAGWRMHSTDDNGQKDATGRTFFQKVGTQETSWNLPDAWKTA